MRSLLPLPHWGLAALLIVFALFLAACDTRTLEPGIARESPDGGRDELFFEDNDVVGIPDDALTPEGDLRAGDDELPLDQDEVVGVEDERVQAETEPTPAGTAAATATADTSQIQVMPTPTNTPTPALPANPSPTNTVVFQDDEIGLQDMGIAWQGNAFELTGRVDAIYEGARYFDVSYPDEFGRPRTRSIYLRPGRTFADYDFVEGDVVGVRGVRELNNYLFADSIRLEN